MGRVIPKDRISDLEANWTPSKSLNVRTETDSEGNLFFRDAVTDSLLTVIPSKTAGAGLTPYIHFVPQPLGGFYHWCTECAELEAEDYTDTLIGAGSQVTYSNWDFNCWWLRAYDTLDDNAQRQSKFKGFRFIPGNNQWFLAHVYFLEQTNLEMMVGLANEDTTLITAGGGVLQCSDFVGYSVDAGDQNIDFTTMASSTATTTDTGFDLSDAWFKFAFHCDGTNITPYINGIAGTPHSTNIPGPEAKLALSFAIATKENVDKNMFIQYAHVLMHRT